MTQYTRLLTTWPIHALLYVSMRKLYHRVCAIKDEICREKDGAGSFYDRVLKYSHRHFSVNFQVLKITLTAAKFGTTGTRYLLFHWGQCTCQIASAAHGHCIIKYFFLILCLGNRLPCILADVESIGQQIRFRLTLTSARL